jgi:glycosyltransferase involved in cell wall biosynthesis
MKASAGRTEIGMTARRVLIIVENLPVPFDRRVWQEARELVAAGYTVSVICPAGRGYESRYELLEGVHIYRHWMPKEAQNKLGYLIEYPIALFWEFALAWKVLFANGFDVIQGCNPPDTIFLIGGFFKLFMRKKYVFDHHDIVPELYEAKFGSRTLVFKLMALLERLTFMTADVSIATNNSYRKIAIERGGMAPEKVFVVRNGPRLDKMKIRPPVPALKKGRRFMVGYVGMIGRQEGLEHLLEAARYIIFEKHRDDIQFTIVGDGPGLEDIRALAAVKGLTDHVNFTGRIVDDALLEVLNTADVCVNPDSVNPMNDKSTMIKIMEYMSVAKPIVQFDVTEGRFSADRASLYAGANDAVDMGDKILQLIDDPELRTEMGRFGRQRVETDLAWNFQAPNLLAAYDEVFGGTRVVTSPAVTNAAVENIAGGAAASPEQR